MTESSVRPELITRGEKWQDYAFIGDVDSKYAFPETSYMRIADVSQVVLVDLSTTPDDEVHQVILQTRSHFHEFISR